MVLLGPADNAPTGKTVDFSNGPIIPTPVGTLFLVDGDTLRESVVIDPNFDSQYPPLPADDGYSHIVLGFATSTDFIPPGTPVTGNYAFRLRLIATVGNEVQVELPYVVK